MGRIVKDGGGLAMRVGEARGDTPQRQVLGRPKELTPDTRNPPFETPNPKSEA